MASLELTSRTANTMNKIAEVNPTHKLIPLLDYTRSSTSPLLALPHTPSHLSKSYQELELTQHKPYCPFSLLYPTLQSQLFTQLKLTQLEKHTTCIPLIYLSLFVYSPILFSNSYLVLLLLSSLILYDALPLCLHSEPSPLIPLFITRIVTLQSSILQLLHLHLLLIYQKYCKNTKHEKQRYIIFMQSLNVQSAGQKRRQELLMCWSIRRLE